MSLQTIEGSLQANGGKYAIVVGRWNAFIVESLVNGAVDSLTPSWSSGRRHYYRSLPRRVRNSIDC